MILESLVFQLEQRFLHEKRAQVCLFFDERQEFVRVLPALREHLEGIKPAPFRLLEYDADQFHGQIWLKRQIQLARSAVSQAQRRQLRFVVYVPLSEDRLESSSEREEPGLELLEEYRAAGVLFRIGGKRPTLFSFLRLAGVPLPDAPSEQRKLYEGGRNSLLSKYVTAFANRPAAFWSTVLTPELVRSRLIGDVDQSILELAFEPEDAWNQMHERGLLTEFLELVRERYGYEAQHADPADWVRGLVAMAALCETWLAYYEPLDFPLLERLPPAPLRSHHVALAQRWLRDSEYRQTWDRWVSEVEHSVNLASWASSRPGRSVAFPHLVWQRWQAVYAQFSAAAGKDSTTRQFFESHRKLIADQAEYRKMTQHELGEWSVLWELDLFIVSCDAGLEALSHADSPSAMVQVYVNHASRIDGAHISLRYAAEEHGLPPVTMVLDRAYATYAIALNAHFFKELEALGDVSVRGIPDVTSHLQQTLWKGKERRAVIIVDGFRYDCALTLKQHLRGLSVEVEPMMAMLPTVTSVGMTALMPLAGVDVGLEVKGNVIHPRAKGKDLADRDNRLAFMRAFGADCRDIGDMEALSAAPEDLGNLLVVFGHEELDHIGHGNAEALIRHFDLEIQRLARLIRKLHRLGYVKVHVVTDHGFILMDESRLPPETPCKEEWCYVMKERFALVPALADLPLVRFPLLWNLDMRVAVPAGMSFFKLEKSFSHGGATLQELIIPHLVSKDQTTQKRRVEIEVVLPTYELTRSAVKVILRPKPAATSGPGQLTLFSEKGRTLALDVVRFSGEGKGASVVSGKPKELKIEPKSGEQTTTLFFHSSAKFQKDEILSLEIRDIETLEQIPPGGIKLTVGRDM